MEASKLVEDGDEDPEFETRSNAVMIGMTEWTLQIGSQLKDNLVFKIWNSGEPHKNNNSQPSQLRNWNLESYPHVCAARLADHIWN